MIDSPAFVDDRNSVLKLVGTRLRINGSPTVAAHVIIHGRIHVGKGTICDFPPTLPSISSYVTWARA